ncbi:response regulator [Marivirga sp.]|uniref:response regulator n=1 Tax=Marivirga sp. TaxID=2018662 RepID=UPI003DA6FEC7
MRALNILQVEDNEIDIIITEEILDQGRVLKTLNAVSTAEEALLYLNKKSPFQTVELPDLILLDINLPISNGFSVLFEVKNNPELSHIPVIILSSSTSDYDRSFAFKNGADEFFEKPLEIDLLKYYLSKLEENLSLADSKIINQ